MMNDRDGSPELYKSSLSKVFAKGYNTEPWRVHIIFFPWAKSTPTATLKYFLFCFSPHLTILLSLLNRE